MSSIDQTHLGTGMAKPFTVGRVLGQGFGSFFRWILSLTVVAFLLYLPVVAINWAVVVGVGPAWFDPFSSYMEASVSGRVDQFFAQFEGISSGMATLALLLQFLGWFFLLLAIAGVSHLIVQRLRGQTVGIGGALSAAPRLGLSMLGMSVSSILLLLLYIVAFSVVVGIGATIGSDIMIIILIAAMVIVGIYLTILFFVSIPAAALEAPGFLSGLYRGFLRSAALTRGNRWRLFAISVVLFLVSIIVMMLFGAVMALAGTQQFLLFASMMEDPDRMAEFSMTTAYLVLAAVTTVVTALMVAFYTAFPAVAYYRLYLEREGADVDTLTTVFE